MTSKLWLEKKFQKKFKLCFKFVLLAKKFKKRTQCYIPKSFFKRNDYEHQNTQYS